MSLDHDVLLDQVARLPFAVEQREALAAILAETPTEPGMRATYARLEDTVVSSLLLDEATAVRARIAALPRYPPFSFMPLTELVLRLAIVGARLCPQSTLCEATNETMARHVGAMRRHGTLKAMLEAGGDGLFDYLELVSESADHFYNFGRRTMTRTSATGAVLSFEDYDPALSRYWLVGLNRGLMRLFGADGRLDYVGVDQRHFELHVALST